MSQAPSYALLCVRLYLVHSWQHSSPPPSLHNQRTHRTTFLPFVVVWYPFVQLSGCSIPASILRPRVALRFRPPPAVCPVGSAAVDGGTCHALPRPCHAGPGRVRERDIHTIRGLGSSCLFVTGWGTGGPFLSSTRICRMGSPASPAYSNCRSQGAWAPSTPQGMSGAPYTSLLPCNAPACLDSPVPLERCSNCASEALARCSCPLAPPFLLQLPDFTFSHESCAMSPRRQQSLCLFIFLLVVLCLSCVPSRSDLHSHVLPAHQ